MKRGFMYYTRKMIKLLLLGLLLFFRAENSNAEILNRSNFKEKIGIYALYNIQQNPNKEDWIDTGFNTNGYGGKSSLKMMGVGLKYFPKKWLLFDISGKTLISPTKAGAASVNAGVSKYYASLQELNSYTFAVNYYYDLVKNTKVYVGLGRGLYSARFRPFGEDSYRSPYTTQFYTWISRTGIEYQLTERCAFSLSIGHEKSVNLKLVDCDDRIFQYKYESPYFIEPAITLYF